MQKSVKLTENEEEDKKTEFFVGRSMTWFVSHIC